MTTKQVRWAMVLSALAFIGGIMIIAVFRETFFIVGFPMMAVGLAVGVVSVNELSEAATYNRVARELIRKENR